jgi:hypothetical protein
VLGVDGYVGWGDRSEHIQNEKRNGELDVATMQRTMRDYEAIARIVRTRAVRLLFVGYPFQNEVFTPLSNAMRLVGAREHAEFVDANAAVRRVPPDQLTTTFGLHAGPAGLTEIARDLARAILSTPTSPARAPSTK